MPLFEFLKSRGFIYQTTDDAAIAGLLNGNISFYAGFDPTADSLHVGHLLPIMLIRHLLRNNHKAIVLIGGATALIGDPSGKKEARSILSPEKIEENYAAIKKQLENLISADDKKHNVIFVNNAEWLSQMTMLDYLRDLGSKFSVNKMLSSESVKQRLQSGISYLEFSYSILQAYDFLHLNKKYNCILQIGGQDQWGNIVSGTDLIRRFNSVQAYGLTVPLLLASSGEKFGKTADGAVWLSPQKTSPFDYYQFWRNTTDTDCGKFLRLFTDLPDEEIKNLESLPPPLINRTKEILAFESTKIVHGKKAASESFLSATSKFGSADPNNTVKTSSEITEISINAASEEKIQTACIREIPNENSVWIIRILTESGLCSSNGEARRLISGGGAYLNGEKITDPAMNLPAADVKSDRLIISAGKKNHKRIIFANQA
jgi:tyrosyl-tRNA synthetase